ncbi:hypothetical protein MVEN_00860100 [Mycena venus]|uniref:Uncharacterized protein n=1 Tax=Mycena venus TaxID=2733690 RepID=A0A8H7D1K1_9AGAR|nr:hypothetical protein MVEN_00860100 [Mycena venus]
MAYYNQYPNSYASQNPGSSYHAHPTYPQESYQAHPAHPAPHGYPMHPVPPQGYQAHPAYPAQQEYPEEKQGGMYGQQPQADQPPMSSAEESEFMNTALNFTQRPTHLPPGPRLAYPVLIPQTSPGRNTSFSRAWAAELALYDISIGEFLEFIDHLNVVRTASPPLQAIGLAGTAMSFVPHHWVQLAGHITELSADVASAVVAKGRMKSFLDRTNADFFGPRGLRVRVVKDKEVPMITGQPPTAPELAPVSGGYSADSASLRTRRLIALQGYIAPLQFDGLPPMSRETGKLDQLAAKSLLRKEAKSHSKALEEAGKGQKDYQEKMQKLQEEEAEVYAKAREEMAKKPEDRAKIEEDLRKELDKLVEERQKVISDTERKVADDQGKEDNDAKMFMWIVIENAA